MTTPDSLVVPGEGTLAQVMVDGVAVAVTMVDGVVHAVDDECTHGGCSLSGGDVEGSSIVCPCHFGTFDLRTDAVLSGPPPRPVGVWTATVLDGRLELSR